MSCFTITALGYNAANSGRRVSLRLASPGNVSGDGGKDVNTTMRFDERGTRKRGCSRNPNDGYNSFLEGSDSEVENVLSNTNHGLGWIICTFPSDSLPLSCHTMAAA